MVRGVEREGLISTKLFVAASFIAFCVLAVALLGTAVEEEKAAICGPFLSGCGARIRT
jgi:hypothetical protein